MSGSLCPRARTRRQTQVAPVRGRIAPLARSLTRLPSPSLSLSLAPWAANKRRFHKAGCDRHSPKQTFHSDFLPAVALRPSLPHPHPPQTHTRLFSHTLPRPHTCTPLCSLANTADVSPHGEIRHRVKTTKPFSLSLPPEGPTCKKIKMQLTVVVFFS